jgi:hypothetical protein
MEKGEEGNNNVVMIHSHPSMHYQTKSEVYTTVFPEMFQLLHLPISITCTQNRTKVQLFLTKLYCVSLYAIYYNQFY